VGEDLAIRDSALRHGYTEEQINHALRNPVKPPVLEQGDLELMVVIGATPSGEVIEVGVMSPGLPGARVVHAMHARKKYWP
jgi:hypothetical protein